MCYQIYDRFIPLVDIKTTSKSSRPLSLVEFTRPRLCKEECKILRDTCRLVVDDLDVSQYLDYAFEELFCYNLSKSCTTDFSGVKISFKDEEYIPMTDTQLYLWQTSRYLKYCFTKRVYLKPLITSMVKKGKDVAFKSLLSDGYQLAINEIKDYSTYFRHTLSPKLSKKMSPVVKKAKKRVQDVYDSFAKTDL
ncbi:hypothetical protein RF11_12518 [Thelohanellus kitauei]|uniref:Uncharacterized protein n=1 Tax=Thelohanellus kitauei TaxID=669202 RepID=A0A0C2N0T0_THEKT|nr:hypothetical protein RF11_12518 [Thelohanellus kitauei]